MKTKELDVAIIIINYNSGDFTLECVSSILFQTSKSIKYQIIIVDNASRQDELLKLKDLDANPLIKILYSPVNLGFGGGNMFGAENVNARHLYFLNNDCILLNDCLSILLDFCNHNPGTGLCGAQIYSGEHQRILSFNYIPSPALKFLGPDLLRLFNPKQYPNKRKVYDAPVKVELVSGCGLFFNFQAFEQIGGFDPNLFFYCEEEDLAVRLKENGWSVYFVPDAKYIHFGGASSSDNLIMLKEYYISLLYFFRKHYSGLSYFFLKLLYAFKFLRKSVKSRKYRSFVGFIMKGAPMEESLKYLQSNS